MTIRCTLRLFVATLVIASGLALVTSVAGPAAPADALPGSFVVDAGSPQTFTVPAYVRQIQVMARGGAGQDGLGDGDGDTGHGGRGGNGGVVTTTLQVTPGDVLRLVAGGSGWHADWVAPGFGGGSGGPGDPNGADGGRGGSASVVWVNSDLAVVAGGGGGGGGEGGDPFTADNGGPGGAGNGLPGTSGDGPAAGAGGIGAVTWRTDGRGGDAGGAGFGTVAGGGAGGGGGWLPSLNAGGGVAGRSGGLGGGGGGGAAGGTSWTADAGATTSIAPVQAEGQIVLRWAPRPIATISVSPNPALEGSRVRVTANVGVPLADAPVPTGRVTFQSFDPETGEIDLVAAGPIDNGSTWFETDAFPPGQNFLRVVYSGDSYYESTSSGWYNELIEAPHPALTAAVATVDFGTQEVGTAQERTFTVTNSGNVSVRPTGVSSSNLAFGVTGWTCATLAPGASCDVVVSFVPATTGTQSGQVTVHDASGTAASVRVTGRSVIAQPSASATSLDFGTVAIGSTARRTVTITNNGEATWAFNAPVLVGNRAFTSSTTCTGSLAPRTSCTVAYAYAPTAATRQSGYTLITDSNGRVALVITYTGTGKVPAPVVSTITPVSGPAAGGTRVTVTGRNLANATAVRFGTHAARSFSCATSTTCTAVSPSGTKGTVVDLRVVTAGGTSAAVTADRFRYTA